MKPMLLQLYEVVIWGERKDAPIYRLGTQAFSEDEAKEAVLKQFRGSPDWVYQPVPKITRVEVLSDVHLNPARKQHTLFEDIADACVGNSLKDIQGAMVNMLITAVQRRYIKLADAEARWDELLGRGKVALQKRYRKETDATAEDEIARRVVG